ncbi:LysM peptidoglycan-binding domain-containing protein [Kineosporia rhizophila]|uniref:LysM peptidoglycan-binding domain-containing protein n=1 Tax=Kineosporia TaxID=49184 RepID=UPI001E3335D6|nr:LysM peptidoglycan-binding domain-containing protein [Kineosporia sp. NBRC 101677]MCE0537259.1 LysM peptidoglycan-binding domain-containing protein [Kineosporia rhizophila]
MRSGAGQVAPAQGAVPAAPERDALRLTRRGQVVVRAGAALLASTSVLAGVLLINRTAEAGSDVQPVSVSYRVVLPGETLWAIAGEVDPEGDRSETVADIMDLNALTDPAVAAGQRIALPGN